MSNKTTIVDWFIDQHPETLPALKPILEGNSIGAEPLVKLLKQAFEAGRRHSSKYQEMKYFSEYHDLLQYLCPVYKRGGDRINGPKAPLKLGDLIAQTTNLNRSAFYGKVRTYKHLSNLVCEYLESNPHCATARKGLWLEALSNYTVAEQNRLVNVLAIYPDPAQAYMATSRCDTANQ